MLGQFNKDLELSSVEAEKQNKINLGALLYLIYQKSIQDKAFIRYKNDQLCPENCPTLVGSLQTLAQKAKPDIQLDMAKIDASVSGITRFFPGFVRMETIRGHLGVHVAFFREWVEDAEDSNAKEIFQIAYINLENLTNEQLGTIIAKRLG